MADIGSQVLGVGQMVTREGWVTNEGNFDSDQYAIKFVCNFDNDGAGIWTVNIREDDTNNLIAILTPGAGSTFTTVEPVAEDGDFGFYHEITALTSEGAGGGQPGDQVVITTTATTDSEPVGQYTGANGLTYGGTSEVISVSTYSISKPVMVVTRTSTVDAPKSAVGYAGDSHDAVPGSCITYTIDYSNTGNESAYDVILVNKLPNNTTLGHFNEDSDTSYVIITASQGAAAGWTISYSTDSSPTTEYGDTGDWTQIGMLAGGAERYPGSGVLYFNTSNQFNATYVKWEKPTVATTEDNKTLTWGAIIR